MKMRILLYILYLPFFLAGSACKKDWLEQKSDKGLSVPQTPADFQAILDNPNTMNRSYSYVGNSGTDNIYISDDVAGTLQEFELNLYLWKKDIPWNNESSSQWAFPYTVIECANIALDGINKLGQKDNAVNNIKGQALFYRAYAYYSTAQVFCLQYESQTAGTALGLPIRTQPDVNMLAQRSNLQEVYNLIISDLKQASSLLPGTTPYYTRPLKVSALAMLSRVYLNMQDYQNAKLYADSALTLKPTLIDFNDPSQVSNSMAFRFKANGIGNPEILFYAFKYTNNFDQAFLGQGIQASPELYSLYEDNDLRKTYFFGKSNNRLNFVGSYTGARPDFSGIGTNEVYLIRAEASARLNLLAQARTDLNKLLSLRYKTGTAPIITEDNQLALLSIILKERRKELPRTGNTRWEDLRRLNLDPNFAQTINRIYKGEQYSIEPNSPRYVLPIPNNEIRMSGITQNQR
ncbi:RagB/SusD family nutrient uptake outer membrane protein [Sphingobacterium siyangense]|uniref:RagB/SusD family nutrient uptake outer membrane protein n=2 Tax=Sphingobacterium siyangense TaxID=459529 RepID=UPI003DA2C7C1